MGYSASDQVLPITRPPFPPGPGVNPSLRVWINPTQAVIQGGVAVSIPNSATASDVFTFPSGGAGLRPLAGPTRFNGAHPGLGWDGIVERRLQSLMSAGGAFSGDCTFIMAVNSFNGSFDGNLGFTNIFETARDLSDIVSGFDVGPGDFPPVKWEVERFDDLGNNTNAGDTAPPVGPPYVYTATVAHVAGIINQRINGSQISTNTMPEGILTPQQLVVLGGNSNTVDLAFGNLICQFELGDMLLFDSLVTVPDLLAYERFVGGRSGIVF